MDPREAFTFCPKCGNKLEPLEESLQCTSCGFHLYINPVPCNGVIIENEKGEILLVKRKVEPHKGEWDVPGGFMRTGEDAAQCAKREIKEELGVDIDVTGIIGTYTDTYIYQDVSNETISIITKGKIISGSPRAADDVEEFQYFPRDQILNQQIAFPGIRRAIEDYLNKN